MRKRLLLAQANFFSAIYQYNDTSGQRMPWVTGLAPTETLDRYGITGGMVPWNALRSILYGGAPPGLVEFGCKVVGCAAPEDNRPAANTTGGGESAAGGGSDAGDGGGAYASAPAAAPREVLARAKFVIAADGFFSRVRRVAGDGSAPVFQRSVRWLANVPQADLVSGRIPAPAAIKLGTDPTALISSHVWLPASLENLTAQPTRGFLMYSAGTDEASGSEGGGGGARMIWTLFTRVETLEAAGEAYPMRAPAAGGDTVAAAAEGGTTALETVQLSNTTGPRAHERAVLMSAHLPPDVRAIIAATEPERVLEFGSHIHSPDSYVPGAWTDGRGLLLVGDAAHTGRADGQGANLALEDAAVLGALVRQHGLGPETFRVWEAARMQRARDILHDPTPEGSLRFPLIYSATFEPLWCPLKLAGPGGPLPAEVAAEVQAAVAGGGLDKGREVVLAWSRREVRRIVEARVAGRVWVESVAPPPGVVRMR
ncbi:hypothetical protein GPECTOR_11g83 [Gonium pectorale]|uniref:FAD-binding domain-containing protein n=1 Tax=Gonium pectorale TaxID=33097 RepID=A0A150GRK4_GONPE|nr:hypothetical protein GPECTOR_11g83 [Gonium pectorale]|eukprot:KXZ51960.1 hypothetical protein GPECTOR_11g83 [Gonium pectorale]